MTTGEMADRAQRILTDNEIEEWGTAHGERQVTVSWEGGRSDGWRIFAEMLDANLPVRALRRCWRVMEGELTGPQWEIELWPGSEA